MTIGAVRMLLCKNTLHNNIRTQYIHNSNNKESIDQRNDLPMCQINMPRHLHEICVRLQLGHLLLSHPGSDGPCVVLVLGLSLGDLGLHVEDGVQLAAGDVFGPGKFKFFLAEHIVILGYVP